MDTVEARVARGAAWLDEHEPGWERRIDLALLALKDSCRCVLGQVFVDDAASWSWYEDGFDYAVTHMTIDAVSAGFDIRKGLTKAEQARLYAELDEVWISLIKERFDTGNLSDEAR